MAAPIFGRIDDPQNLNLEPFTFTLAGYRLLEDGSKKEELIEFTATGVRPFGVQIDLVRAAVAENNMLSSQAITDFVEASLVSDAERERFREALAQPDVYFETGVLGELANWLGETYSGRPTRPRTVSRSGRAVGGRRSTGGAGGTASPRSAGSQRTPR